MNNHQADRFPQVPNLGRGDAGAGNSSSAGDPTLLPKRRLFYWSVRFAHWDSCRYMAEWTAALQNASGDPTLQTYVRPHPEALDHLASTSIEPAKRSDRGIVGRTGQLEQL